MSAKNPRAARLNKLKCFDLESDVFGAIKIDKDYSARVIKASLPQRDVFTDVAIVPCRRPRAAVSIKFRVYANSPSSAERVGITYLSQLLDLMSVRTRIPITFLMVNESNEHRGRLPLGGTAIDRVLEKDECDWITGNRAYLRKNHQRFLAAASWYRKGLNTLDVLEEFCCFWKVIERLALSYADKMEWSEDKKKKSTTLDVIHQLLEDLFRTDVPKALESDEKIKTLYFLRNDISHGNREIDPEIIEDAAGYIDQMEDAAFQVLDAIRISDKIKCPEP